MASTEEKLDLVDDIKRPTRYYRIKIWGYGGEYTYNTLTQEQFDYWTQNEDDLEGYVSGDLEGNDIPENAQFLKQKEDDNEYSVEWYELDNIEHFHGAEYFSANIVIDEVDSETYNCNIINTIYEDQLDELVDLHDVNVIATESDSLINKNKQPIIECVSSEKGDFNDIIFSTQGKIDLSKLSISIVELPNGDSVIDHISYNDEILNDNGADTNNKGFSVSIFDN